MDVAEARFPLDLVRFARWHWVHLLLAPLLGLTLITFLHELAHAALVLVQGGQLNDFSFLPSTSGFGYVQYSFPPGVSYSAAAISLAPYVMWACFAGLALLLGLLWRTIPFWAGSTAFLWLFAVPMGDCAMACVGHLAGAHNDLYHALGPPDELTALLVMSVATFAFLLGFGLQRLLYRERALSLWGYSALVVAGFAVIGAINLVRV